MLDNIQYSAKVLSHLSLLFTSNCGYWIRKYWYISEKKYISKRKWSQWLQHQKKKACKDLFQISVSLRETH